MAELPKQLDLTETGMHEAYRGVVSTDRQLQAALAHANDLTVGEHDMTIAFSHIDRLRQEQQDVLLRLGEVTLLAMRNQLVTHEGEA